MMLISQIDPDGGHQLADSDERVILTQLEQYLASASIDSSFYGINEMPQGCPPDADGIILYKQDRFWVVAPTSRHRKQMPSIFTSLCEAIDFFLSQIPGQQSASRGPSGNGQVWCDS